MCSSIQALVGSISARLAAAANTNRIQERFFPSSIEFMLPHFAEREDKDGKRAPIVRRFSLNSPVLTL